MIPGLTKMNIPQLFYRRWFQYVSKLPNMFPQISEVVNTAEEQKIKIETADCEVITRERRLDEHMIWDNSTIGVSASI